MTDMETATNEELIEQIVWNCRPRPYSEQTMRSVLPEPSVLRQLAKVIRDHVSEADAEDLARIITGGEIQ